MSRFSSTSGYEMKQCDSDHEQTRVLVTRLINNKITRTQTHTLHAGWHATHFCGLDDAVG